MKLLDSVFTLLSFCFKYLVKSIRANLGDVFGIYSELVCSKNSWVRKFACQSFSYVLRKVTFDHKLIKMLLSQATSELLEQERTHQFLALGISEMLYEVVQGGQAMHSKTPEVINALLTYKESQDEICISSKLVSEMLLLKLVNGIDTSLLKPVFDTMLTNEID